MSRSARRASGRVVAIHRCPAKRAPMERLAEARVTEHGIEGDSHARPGSRRQVLLIDVETLRDVGVSPGVVRENFTVEGVRIQAFPEGTRLRVGGTELEVTGPCAPCARMDEIRLGLQAQLEGRRGVVARVVMAGMVREGDRAAPCDPPGTCTGAL